jgi:hypothetical protein
MYFCDRLSLRSHESYKYLWQHVRCESYSTHGTWRVRCTDGKRVARGVEKRVNDGGLWADTIHAHHIKVI